MRDGDRPELRPYPPPDHRLTDVIAGFGMPQDDVRQTDITVLHRTVRRQQSVECAMVLKNPTQSEAVWLRIARDAHQQSCGVMSLHLVENFDALTSRHNRQLYSEMLVERFGMPYVTILLQAIRQVADNYRRRAARRDPRECLTCRARIFNLRGCVGVISAPDVHAPKRGLGAVLCPRCAAGPDLCGTVREVYRVTWPEACVIDVIRHKALIRS
jgi:hypothetical protein